MSRQKETIAIIGGGIGGLAAALSLWKAGFDAHVYEQASAIREVGAGIVLTPNATRLLYGLGLRGDLEKLGVAPVAWRQRRWDDGKTLLLSPVAVKSGPAAFLTLHRADLISMLVDALPPERLHLNHRLAGFSDRDGHVDLQFENGTTIKADMLVGADGIHSSVRKLLFGEEQPRFTGCVAYRGLVPAEQLNHLDLPSESQIWLGPGRHFVHYPVQASRLVNFVCLIDRDAWTKESWTEPGNVADVLDAFAAWHRQVRSIISAVAASEIFVWGLFDRLPLARWSVGRVTLLGDSCHPMLPFMAQGAAQAIEDAATLSAVLSAGDVDVQQALRRYESLRLPRTALIQSGAAGNKTRNHLPDGPAQRDRDSHMASGAADWSIGASKWIYDHDAAAAADTGSLGLRDMAEIGR
jgi:salicylate hydroxylase